MVTHVETLWVLVSIVFLLIGVFLTSLCSRCPKRSLELQELVVEENPSTLIRVVKLDEVFENPAITTEDKDEEDTLPEEVSISFTPWRSHLVAPESKGVSDSSSDSANISQTLPSGRDNGGDEAFPPANQELEQDQDARLEADLVYARISKKPGTSDTPEEEEEKEEPSPPLPDRTEETEKTDLKD